jgi:O-antigen/teichoic acid export membrane protein
LTFVLIYWGGLVGAVLSLISTALVHLLLSSLALRHLCRTHRLTPDYRHCLTERRTLWHFSVPAVLAGSMLAPVTWAAHAILVQQPNGYGELGLFYAASKLQVLILFVSNAVGLVTGPLLAEIHGSRDFEQFAQATNLNLKATWSLALPLGFLLIGLSPWLMALFGPAFQEARAIPSLLICVAVLNLVNDAIGQTLVSSGRMWAGVALYLAWGLALLIAARLFIPLMGALGLSLAYFIASAGHAGWALLYARLHFGRGSAAHSLGLAGLTGVMFLFALNIGGLSNGSQLSLSLLGAAVSLAWGWRLLPAEGRRQFLAVASMRG